MKLRNYILVVFLVLVMVGCPNFALANSPAEELEVIQWNQEIARQLVAEGWEYAPQQEFPVILYGIEVVELEQHMSSYLDLAFAASFPGDESGDWSVNASPEMLQIIADNYLSMDIQMSDGTQSDFSWINNTTWLGTVAEKPVSISLSKGSAVDSDSQARFELQLTPIQLGYSRQQIQTEIVLDCESAEGNLAQVNSTAWVGFEEPQPIAVVSVVQEGKRTNQRKHLAMFLRAAVLPAEDYPQEVPVMQVGSVQELTDLFDEILSPAEAEEAYAHFVNLGVLSDGEDFGYSGQYTGMLQEGLGFTLLVVGEPGDPNPVVYVGVIDELQFGDNLTVRVSLLPLAWDTLNNELRDKINGRLEVFFTENNWAIGYGADYAAENWRHSVTFKYNPKEKVSWEFGASVQNGQYSYRAGITFRL